MDGLFWVNSNVKLTDIRDGSSNTFLLFDQTNYLDQSWLPDAYGSNHFIWVHHPSQGYIQGYSLPNSDVLPGPDSPQYRPSRLCRRECRCRAARPVPHFGARTSRQACRTRP